MRSLALLRPFRVARGVRVLQSAFRRPFSSDESWRHSVRTKEGEASAALRNNEVDPAKAALYDALKLSLVNDDASKASSLMDQLVSVHLSEALSSPSSDNMAQAQELMQHNEALLQKTGNTAALAAAILRRGRRLEHFPHLEAEAKAAYEECIALLTQAKMVDEVLVLARLSLAKVLAEDALNDSQDRVRAEFEQALQECDQLPRPEDDRILELSANVHVSYATFFVSLQRYPVALEYIEKGVERLTRVFASNHPSLLQAQALMAHCLSMLGRHKEASTISRNVMAVVNQGSEVFPPHLADLILACSLAIDLGGDSATALEILKKAKEDFTDQQEDVEDFERAIEMIQQRVDNSKGLDKRIVE